MCVQILQDVSFFAIFANQHIFTKIKTRKTMCVAVTQLAVAVTMEQDALLKASSSEDNVDPLKSDMRG